MKEVSRIESLDKVQQFASNEFDVLVKYFIEKNSLFVDCLEQGRSPLYSSVSFRYDIHLRDIHCAYSFLKKHIEYSIPATFYILYDYSVREREFSQEFDDFAAAVLDAPSNIKLGLHDSPVDSYLIKSVTDGQELAYSKWLKDGGGVNFFIELLTSEEMFKHFEDRVTKYFVDRVARFRSDFGCFETMASHGGPLSQILRPNVPMLGKIGDLVFGLFSENWVNDERLSIAELSADVERFKHRVDNWVCITEGGGKIVSMCENIKKFSNQKKAINVLIHPATWQRDIRDGEFSSLLFENMDILIKSEKRDGSPVGLNGLCIVSASDKTVESDLVKSGLKTADLTALTVEPIALASPKLPNVICQRFSEHLTGCCVGNFSQLIIGDSMARYGELVNSAISAMWPNCSNVTDVSAVHLGAWLKRRYQDIGSNSNAVLNLSSSELDYFLFSSSVRAGLIAKVICKLLINKDIKCFVGHGAGIGFVPLIVNSHINISRIECSEIKDQFIRAGTELWNSVGMGNRIGFHKCGAQDFIYPELVTIVLFAQMLYRIEPDRRQDMISSAWESIEPGGLLIINELMDRDQYIAGGKLLTSIELKGYLPKGCDAYLCWGNSTGDISSVNLNYADNKLFKRSDCFVALKK